MGDTFYGSEGVLFVCKKMTTSSGAHILSQCKNLCLWLISYFSSYYAAHMRPKNKLFKRCVFYGYYTYITRKKSFQL